VRFAICGLGRDGHGRGHAWAGATLCPAADGLGGNGLG
jgi:hypothetical protein